MVFFMGVLVANAQMSHTKVKPADLPKAITENVTKDYSGYMIKDATKVTDNKTITYDVKITKGNTSETLVYDKDGKFLRKMTTPPTASTSQKKSSGMGSKSTSNPPKK